MTSTRAIALLSTTLLVLSLPAAQAAESEDTDGWDAGVAIGYSRNSGNTENSLLNASVSGVNRAGKNITRVGVEGAYGETEVENEDGTTRDDTTTQNAKGYANYKRTYGRLFVYADASILHDDIADIDYRGIVGPGVGCFIVQTDAASVSVEAGPSYVAEKVGGIEDDYVAARLAERYDRKISDTARLWQSVEYLPRSDDIGDYLVIGEIGVEAALNSSLSLRVTAKDQYDDTPAEGQEKNDLSVVAAINYKLW